MSSSTHEQIQDRLAAVVKEYAAAVEEGGRFAPVREDHGVTQTEAAIAASGLLDAADIAIFELSMWQSWGLR